jgi:hypothetical protein
VATVGDVGLLVIPADRTESVTTSGERTTGGLTLLQAEGVGVLLLLAVPVILTLGPLLAPRQVHEVATVLTGDREPLTAFPRVRGS